jgi:UDP-N-acetylmuramyl pentapeptide phosphotransferase/UDP-N-acetylglucosamine-1-phosphate transferase
MTDILHLFSNLYFLAVLATMVTFVLSTKMYLYPVIIHVSKKKMLMDEPVDRSAHSILVPRLGGLGLFLTFSLTLIVFGLLVDSTSLDLIKINSLLASAIILLFLGVKDDLVYIAPKKKLIGQIIAVCLVIFLSDVRIKSFDGLLAVGELPYVVSILFTIFVFVLVINAINLIDGIDGLAGSIAILASASFGVFFLINGHTMMTLISFILIGALAGFLTYNFSSTRKIFMGDCGSMFVGFLLAYQGISFLTYNATLISPNHLTNAPILLLAILSFPLLDTLRVFAIRIKEKRSPFSADRNHIHHRLLDIGFNHKQGTLLILACTISIIGVTFLVGKININLQLLIIVLAGLLFYLSPYLSVFEKSIKIVPLNGNEDHKVMDIKDVIVNGKDQKKIPRLVDIKEHADLHKKGKHSLLRDPELQNSENKNSQIPKYVANRAVIFNESIKSKKQNK